MFVIVVIVVDIVVDIVVTATKVRVFSLEDVMMVFARGSANRATAATNLNERSSRSHLILQVSVTTSTNDESSVRAKLSLVDLAGSERVSKSGYVISASYLSFVAIHMVVASTRRVFLMFGITIVLYGIVLYCSSMGSALKEAQHINKSLSALGDVMEALDQKQKHVPYRLAFLLTVASVYDDSLDVFWVA